MPHAGCLRKICIHCFPVFLPTIINQLNVTESMFQKLSITCLKYGTGRAGIGEKTWFD